VNDDDEVSLMIDVIPIPELHVLVLLVLVVHVVDLYLSELKQKKELR
jgi:hypothetical protein